MVWEMLFLARPALLKYGDEFLGDVDRPAVIPSLLEPDCQLLRSILVQYIHVQLTIALQSSEREVTAAHIAHDGVDAVVTESQVQLGVQWVSQKELNHHLARTQLLGELPQAFL